ncbi:MAG: hypothetical protein H6735_03220 [Alphaproteobacteria bacterium]|nr:hypothetical protein [Alphaproteobacteria bacterium]
MEQERPRPPRRSEAHASQAATSASVEGYLVGPPTRWARDWALIGLASGALAPIGLGMWSNPAGIAFVVAAGLVGMIVGAAIGGFAPAVLERVRGRWPIPALLMLGLPIGAVWGALAGLAGGLAVGDPSFLVYSVFGAAIAGAAQLGATWFPYTFLSVLQRRTWPVVLLSVLAAPLLGWLAVVLMVVV